MINEGFEAGFLQVLVTLKYIAPLDAAKLLVTYHESDIDQLEYFLLHEGILEREQLLEALSHYYSVPSFDVTGYFFETHLLRMIPKDILLRNEIIPLQVDENIMIVVAAKPDNSDLLFEIGEYVSYDIRFYVGIGKDICNAIKEYYEKSDTEINRDDQDTYQDLLREEVTHDTLDNTLHNQLEDDEEDPFE